MTVADQPVRYIRDKSGKGRHLVSSGGPGTLATDGARRWIAVPVNCQYRTSATGFVPIAGTHIGAACKPTDLGSGYILGAVNSNTNRFACYRGTTQISFVYAAPDDGPTAPKTVPDSRFDMHVDSQSAKMTYVNLDNNVNKVAGASAGPPQYEAGSINVPCYIVINTDISLPSQAASSTINFYAGIVIGRALTAEERANCTTFFGSKAGQTL